MKEFNLEEALAGSPVITRGGKEVTQIVLFKADKEYPLFCVVDEEIISYTKEGKSFSSGESNYDLFMKPTKKSGWTAVLRLNNGQVVVSETIHKTKQRVEEIFWTNCKVLDIIEITWEE